MTKPSNKYIYLDADEENKINGVTREGSSEENAVFWRLEPGLVTEEQLVTLEAYFAEILKFNSKLNLVSKKTINNSDLLHFYDSIQASKYIAQSHSPKALFDLGSGNGFPGVVYAILNPGCEVVLIDHDRRKVEFLKHLKSAISIDNFTPKCLEISSLPDNCMDFAICRGLASIAKVLLILRKQLKKGGTLFHLKGPNWVSEINDIPSQLLLSWASELKYEYELPEEMGHRYLVESQLV